MDFKLTAFFVGLFDTIVGIVEYKIALRVHERKRKKANSSKSTQIIILQVISLCNSIGLLYGGSNCTEKISRELRM